MTSRSAGSRASSVSRLLRRSGISPLPSGVAFHREGVRVKGGETNTRIVIDMDHRGYARRLADGVADILTADGRVYQREDDSDTGIIVFILPVEVA